MLADWYYCDDCKSIFMGEDVHVITHRDVHYWLDDQPVETSYEYLCPECGSPCIEEASYCEECGEVCLPEDLDENWLCAECRKKYEQEEKEQNAMQ